jgi:hypothetical protein
MTGHSSELEAVGPPYLQVAARLRSEIAQGRFPPGAQLPSQEKLANRFGVARGTIQQALKELHNQGLVTSRRGSGTFVRPGGGNGVHPAEAPPEHRSPTLWTPLATGPGPGPGSGSRRQTGQGHRFLQPLLQNALGARDTTIDFYGFTAETLTSSLVEPFAMIRSGDLHPPDSLTIRMLLPSPGAHLALPKNVDDPDDPRPVDKVSEIRAWQTNDLRQKVEGLVYRERLAAARVLVREVPITPITKLYLLNRREVISGFYQVKQKRMRVSEDTVLDHVYDVEGFDAYLFRNVMDDDPRSMDSRYVEESQRWFDSIWNTIARDPEPVTGPAMGSD